MRLRPYQMQMIYDIREAWGVAQNVLGVLPTGAGKTVIFSRIIADFGGRSLAIAHRAELIGQISCALAENGVMHTVLGPNSLVKFIVRLHIGRFGRSFFDVAANTAVASVDTLRSRLRSRNASVYAEWLRGVKLWVVDECHHITQGNKWGAVIDAVHPQSRGLGVTATPLRADGKGLGRAYDGYFDTMVTGPSMRDIINNGYLTDYRIVCPRTTGLDLGAVKMGANGDYSKPQLKTAIRKSRIVGDVVAAYLKFASGKLGVTFVTDTDTASDIAEEYNLAGVPAETVDYRTPDAEREAILRRFKNREILQVVNVDLFGEGFDLPAIEVVSFARPTMSYGLYVQQFGRALRPLDSKNKAVIIDHVGNVVERHGLPDTPREWTLERRQRRASKNETKVLIKNCLNPDCLQVYERYRAVCPFCGFRPVAQNRNAPEFVDGDLMELDELVLARLRGEVAYRDRPIDSVRDDLRKKRAPEIGVLAAAKRHETARKARNSLRAAIDIWSGMKATEGVLEPSDRYRLFYLTFGTDVLTAQTLTEKEMYVLNERILNGVYRSADAN